MAEPHIGRASGKHRGGQRPAAGGAEGPAGDETARADSAPVGRGRKETLDQRADRNWTDLLQEFRVMQTGVQLLSGFLLTLPFHDTFAELSTFQRNTYLVLVLLAACTTAATLAPIAVHRRSFRRRRKEVLVRSGHLLAQVVLALVGALLALTTFFVFDVAVGRGPAVVAGVAILLVASAALVLVPALVVRRISR